MKTKSGTVPMSSSVPLFGMLLATFSIQADAGEWVVRSDWAKVLDAQHITGVVSTCSLPEGICQTSDSARSQQRFIPASTFKIPNLLIALNTGVIPPEQTVFPWNGEPRALKQWDKDFTLRGAMLASAVPVFQDFARRIGETRMHDQLTRFEYGNATVSGGIDRFWLDGDLRISAAEQISFLTRLNANTLPVPAEFQWRTKDAMLLEASDQYVLRGKSGYSLGMQGYGDSTKPGIGWWVGWIEYDTRLRVFACNFDITADTQLPLRKNIPLQLFKAEGWLPGRGGN